MRASEACKPRVSEIPDPKIKASPEIHTVNA